MSPCRRRWQRHSSSGARSSEERTRSLPSLTNPTKLSSVLRLLLSTALLLVRASSVFVVVAASSPSRPVSMSRGASTLLLRGASAVARRRGRRTPPPPSSSLPLAFASLASYDATWTDSSLSRRNVRRRAGYDFFSEGASSPVKPRRCFSSSGANRATSSSSRLRSSFLEEDTVFALSSGGGGAGGGATAVSVIRLTGPQSHDALRHLLRKPGQELDDVKLPEARLSSVRTLYDPSTASAAGGGEPDVLDESLILLFSGPKSFTGEDVAEIHCHGSRAVVRGVLDALEYLGRRGDDDAPQEEEDPGDGPTGGGSLNLRPAEPGEFTQRAYARGKLGLCEVEALADLISADTSSQRKLALRQFDGRLSRLYEGWRTELVGALAHAEAVIDFGDDEDLGPDDGTAYSDGDEDGDGEGGGARDEWDTGEAGVWDAIAPRIASLRSRMVRHLSDSHRGEILRSGLRIAIVGPPNAGKSSLLNVLADRDAAIVSPVAGTTRDVVEVTLDLGGIKCVVSDTAGMRGSGEEGVNEIEVEGMRRARRAAKEAHVVVAVADGTEEGRGQRDLGDLLLLGEDGETEDEEDNFIEEEGKKEGRRPDVLYVTNKIDLLEGRSAPAADENNSGAAAFGISCETNEGVDDFLSALTDAVLRRVSGSGGSSGGGSSSGSGEEGETATNSEEGDEEEDEGGAVITRRRHRLHVRSAADALVRFEVLSGGGYMAADVAAEELRLACSELGRVTGAIDVEDVLDVLFADFCIGK